MNQEIIINTPPPTISGNLHIGHIFSYTHIDCVAKTMKFLGNEVIFPIGFDCNGLPTENLLRKTTKSIDGYCQDYIDLFKKMGFAMDFENFYKTIDFDANTIFNKLKSKGLIYETEKEVWFDTALQTPLADCEVIEKDGIFIGEVSKKPVIRQNSKQFFLKTLEFKEQLLTLASEIDFYPASMKIKLTQWIQNLNQDWCISRDRNFGIKIADSDKVFDTWFVSALTYQKFAPQSDFHFQSHEIIRSWCFYSLVMAYHLNCSIPFKKIFISGWCIGKDGQKFSKSSGNFVDPNALIEKYGVNPIRFWAIKANWGTDTYFDENVILNGRRLEVKFKNAKKFFELKNYTTDILEWETHKWKANSKNLISYYDYLLKDFKIKECLETLYTDFFEFCDKDIEACKENKELIDFSFYKLCQFESYLKIFFV